MNVRRVSALRRTVRWSLWLLAALLALAIMLALAAWLALRGSLPRLDGEQALAGLSRPALIERDDNGRATVTAADRLDLARAVGYLHAQERYFEMDLTRRAAAGELAALFGAAALPIDRDRRVHRFRQRARGWLPDLDDPTRAQLAAYAEGVNAGLDDLASRPWPYLLLRQRPEPWRAEDTLLAVVAMFFDLQDETNQRERALDTARRHLHPDAFAFIVRQGTPWDAPLLGAASPQPPLPDPQALDLRDYPPIPPDRDRHGALEPELPGSNNFAVAGRLTAHGRALVADDMHLGLRAPGPWYRVRLVHGEGADRVQVDGFSLPGAPAVVVGSNGHIAWSFTNAYGDWLDLVRLETSTEHPERYLDGDGWQPFESIEEVISVAGADEAVLEIRETRWGPVIGRDADGAPLALAWTAHRAGAVNTDLLALERTRDIEQALAVAHRAGVPAQNLLVGDAGGRIAWTIAGRIPQRRPDHDPALPIASGELTGDLWLGWLAPDAYPRVVDPEGGRLWTANGRVVEGEALALIGDGGYDLGARGGQIRDGLFARERFDEADLLAIQLDDRALFLEPWWDLLREVVDGDDPALARLAAATGHWEGCACVDSVAYRLVRAFRLRVHEAIMTGLAAPVRHHRPDFEWPRLGQAEGVVWDLLRERPAHLLPPSYPDWDTLLRAQAEGVAADLGRQPGGLAARTWGEANTARIRHPLSTALPGFLARRLDMPAQPLPGDSHMPRVQGPQFGASQRMVVAPGLEDRAIGHMPGGNTGHPLSPFHRAGHQDWADGAASRFVPGPARWQLRLRPDEAP